MNSFKIAYLPITYDNQSNIDKLKGLCRKECRAPKPSNPVADNPPVSVKQPDEPEDSLPMIDIAPQAKEQHPANLKALHKQLEELAAERLKQRPDSKRPQTHAVGVPVLVIRGK